MRMWVVDPQILCRVHLLGEHVENHMFLSSLLKKKNLKGFIENNCFEPFSLYSRHKELEEEMIKRNYNHKSPLNEDDFNSSLMYLTEEQKTHRVNRESSLLDLITRCQSCNENYKKKLRGV